MGSYEDMMSGTEEVAEQKPDQGFIGNAWSDVKDIVSKYSTTAYQGFKNVIEKGNTLADTNPLALTGTPMEQGVTNVPEAPPQTEEQKQALSDYSQAETKFYKESIQTPAVAGAIAGAIVPNPLSAVAGVVALPGVASGAVESAKQGYEKGAEIRAPFVGKVNMDPSYLSGLAQTIADFTVNPFQDFWSQENLGQKTYEKPISTLFEGGMATAGLALGAKGVKSGVEKGKYLTDKALEKVDDYMKRPASDAYAQMLEGTEDIRPQAETQVAEQPQIIDNSTVDITGKEGSDVSKLIADRTGLPEDWVYAQMYHETGGFDSRLAKEDHNYAGIKATNPREGIDPPAPDGGFYRHFDSDAEYADYAAKNLEAYREDGLFEAKNITEFAEALKRGGYYTDDVGNYVNGLKSALGAEGSRTNGIGEFKTDTTDYGSGATATERLAERMKVESDQADTALAETEKTAKEAWQMTKDDYEKSQPQTELVKTPEVKLHEQLVEQAIKEDKPVPLDVVKDYPELISKYPDQVAKIIVDSQKQSSLVEGQQGYLGAKEIEPMASTYEKPVTRAEIVKDINDLVVARTGKVGNRAFEGVNKVKEQVIRSRNYGDFDTYSHEIGHYIDNKLKINGHDSELIAGADSSFKGNKVYEQYTPEQKRAEGIAEFGRQYLLNPEQAKTNFPNYFKDFTDKLSFDKQVAKTLDTIGNKMRKWYTQSAEARGRGGISFGDENQTTLKAKAKDLAFKAYEAFFDDKAGLNKLTSAIEKQLGQELEFENNPYKRARMVQNSSLARAEMLVSDSNPELVQYTLNKLYGGKLKYAVTFKDIIAGLDKKTLDAKYPNYLKEGNLENWNKAFSNLLVAKRQLELQKINPEYKGSMSKADAETIVKNVPQELEQASKKYYQYNDNLMSIAEDGGLISKETHNILNEKYKNYAPMMRDFSDEGAMTNMFGAGKKIGNVSNPLKKLTEEGSTRNVIDPLENTIKNTYTLLSAVERNKVAQTFIDLSEKNGLGKFVEKVDGTTGDSKKSIFTVMVDGEKQAFQTTPEFYNSIMSMNQASTGMLVKIFKPFAQALRVGATISPDFVIRNLIRDTLTAGIYSETGFKPVLDTVKGMYELNKNKELAYEFKASGAPLSAFVGLDRSNVSGLLDKMAGGNEWSKVNPLTYVKPLYEGMRKVSEAAESGTRIREFQRAREQGKSLEEAGLLAKDITLDFSRSGALTREINQMIPFFNAVLQGGDRFVRAMKDNPVRTTQFAVKYLMIPSIALWVINHDEDWYKELSIDEKNASWYIAPNVRIPKPFEPGIFFASAPERVLDAMYNKDKKAMTQWAKYAAEGFLPNIMPTLVGPIVEWITNYKFFTDKPVVGRREQALPDKLQYNAYTSELAKKIGDFTNTSPMKVDNLIQGYTASAGKFVVGTLDNLIGNPKELPAKQINELPGIKGLAFTQFKNPRSVEEFYENADKIEKDYAASGKKKNPPHEVKQMRKYAEKIGDLNKDNRNITNSDKSPTEKRNLIDANNAKILSIAKKANENFD